MPFAFSSNHTVSPKSPSSLRSMRSVTQAGASLLPSAYVTLNIAVPAAEARDVAYATALRHVLAADDVPPPLADEARDALAGLESAAAADTE